MRLVIHLDRWVQNVVKVLVVLVVLSLTGITNLTWQLLLTYTVLIGTAWYLIDSMFMKVERFDDIFDMASQQQQPQPPQPQPQPPMAQPRIAQQPMAQPPIAQQKPMQPMNVAMPTIPGAPADVSSTFPEKTAKDYGYTYAPSSSWKVPVERPPVCLQEKQCPVCPIYVSTNEYLPYTLLNEGQ
jgi:hypothetical protein